MEVARILQTRWLELRAWPARTAAVAVADPVGVKAYSVTGAGKDMEVTHVIHEPLKRVILAVRSSFLPAIRLSRGPARPWEEAVSSEGCAARETLVFWARRQDGGRWQGTQASSPDEEAEATDRYAAGLTDELRAGTA